MSDKRPFNTRGFTSFVILLTFLTVSLSGAMLYLSPKGRVANWTGWTLLGLTKTQWEALHLTMTIALFTSVVFHLYFNWGFLMRYLRDMANRGLSSKREFSFAALIVVGIFLGTQLSLPPFSTVSALGEDIKDYWENTVPASPYAHAEESSIEQFAANMNLPLDHVTNRLHEKGFAFDDPTITIADLAARYGKTPNELFQELTRSQGAVSGDGASAGNGMGGGMGSGLGQRPLKDVCKAKGVPLEQALAILLEHGIEATGQDTLRAIAHDKGHTPVEVMGWLAP